MNEHNFDDENYVCIPPITELTMNLKEGKDDRNITVHVSPLTQEDSKNLRSIAFDLRVIRYLILFAVVFMVCVFLTCLHFIAP